MDRPISSASCSLRLSEVVLRTSQYEMMKEWYRQLLQLDPYFEHKTVDQRDAKPLAQSTPPAPIRFCFFRLFFEHPLQQVVAIFDVLGTNRNSQNESGLHHVQLSEGTRANLVSRCRLLAACGIVPKRATDHGPTTSCYYQDPDGNMVEIASSNHGMAADYVAARESLEFQRNPFGRPLPLDWFNE